MNGIKRINIVNEDFASLVKLLDQYLVIVDGEDHAFYHQYNNIDAFKYIVLFYKNNVAIACGAIKVYDAKTMEIKRMFTIATERQNGIASKILNELEKWAKELLYEKCILETGAKQIEAIQFYKKNGYDLIPNFGQYRGVINSRCFKKRIAVDIQH